MNKLTSILGLMDVQMRRRESRPAGVAARMVFFTFLLGSVATQAAVSATLTPQLIGRVPGSGIDYIEAVQVLDTNPNEVVLAVRNIGAGCGGGTPAAIWKMTQQSGTVVDAVLKQSLSQIQNVRSSLFESADGTLFTGGGWCGYKPPYYSTDRGERWTTANVGVSPPNSTFAYAELDGKVYAGTGYDPWLGEVYRWLGRGTWERVFQFGKPRTVAHTMTGYQGRLFVGTGIIGPGSCSGTVPVYISSDGTAWTATSGMGSCQQVYWLVIAGNQLVAFTVGSSPTNNFIYRWTGSAWQNIGVNPLINTWRVRPAGTEEGIIFNVGQLPGDVSPGLYQSSDLGLIWTQVAPFPSPKITSLHLEGSTLFLGTERDAGSNAALVYKMNTKSDSDTLFLKTTLSDVDGDGGPEIAVLAHNSVLPQTTVQVKNASTGALVTRISFDGQFVPKKIVNVPDLNGNGAPEMAVLGVRGSDQAVQVEIRDSLSGVQLSAVAFPKAFTPQSLTVLRDARCSGKACLALLQQNPTKLRVQIKDPLTTALIGNISFSSGYVGNGLADIADLNGNHRRELALLADIRGPGVAHNIEIRDSKTGALIRTIGFTAGQSVGSMIKLPDLNHDDGNELAVLQSDVPQMVVFDSRTGADLNTIGTALTKPYFLGTQADTYSDTRLALLGKRASDGQIQAEVYDSSTGAIINTIVFAQEDSTVGFGKIADLNDNGSSELVRWRKQQATQQMTAEIRDGSTGVLINLIAF